MKLTRLACLYYPNHSGRRGDTDQPPRKWLPRRLLLVRHGESIANVHREVYSSTPDWHIPLTAQGREQARDCGRRLRKIIGDEKLYIYYSPYERTKQTLHEIRKSFSDAQIQGEREDERLREQEIGNYQPMRSMDRHWEDRANFSRLYYRFPDGESSADVGDRVSAFFDSLLRERLGLTVPNMNDEAFNKSHDEGVDLALVDDWHGVPSFSPSAPFSESDLTSEGQADAPLADVHERYARESGDHGVRRDLAAHVGEPSGIQPSVAMAGLSLDDAEAAAVHARWQRENSEPGAAPPGAEADADEGTERVERAWEETMTFTEHAARPAGGTRPASSPSTRWCSGSGPARMSRAAMATDLGQPHVAKSSSSSSSPSASSSTRSTRPAGAEPAVPPLPPPPDSDMDMASADDQNVVIVSHGLLLRLFIGRWFRVPMEVFETMSNPPNCAIVVLERDSTHERLVMTEMSKSLFGSDPLLQMMKFDGKEDTQWYRERFLGIIDPELSPVSLLGEDDDENHYSLSTVHNSSLGAPMPRPRPRVATSKSAQSAHPSPSSATADPERTVRASPSSPSAAQSSSSSKATDKGRGTPLGAVGKYYDAKK